ncbi:conserved hypothetical protein [Candidatus Brocadia pituitae]|nr:conserved hypothetical protein [Candidatus Brocadia pituitae]
MENIDVKEIKLDKKAFSTVPLFDESADKAFWLTQSPQARIDQIEILRQINYGDRATERLQRILHITECEWC